MEGAGFVAENEMFETDVVVVGAGGAGLAAALTVAEQGYRVVLLEAGARPGGTTNFPGGIFAVESSVQKAAGISVTKSDVFGQMMEYSHYRSNAALVRTIIERSASTIDWLKERGVEFLGALSVVQGGLPTWHFIDGAGAALVKSLVARCKNHNVELLLKSSAQGLLTDENGICGVQAVVNGDPAEIRAKAVILATGGYASNAEWMKKYAGYAVNENIFLAVNVRLNGDSQRMAWEVGAAQDGMGLLEIEYDLTGPGLIGNQLRNVVRQPYLWVNQRGERLGNEDRICAIPNFAGNVLTRQADKQAFLIFDLETRAHMESVGFSRRGGPPFLDQRASLVDYDEQIASAASAGNPNVFKAETLKSLCAQTGISLNGLEETLDAYNNLADAGEDTQFGKDRELLHAVRTGPFYALRICPTMLGTLGGIKVNPNMSVLDEKDHPISRLYAVGNIASGMYGDTYCIVFPGTTLAFAINSGRIAGEQAVKQIGSAIETPGSTVALSK